MSERKPPALIADAVAFAWERPNAKPEWVPLGDVTAMIPAFPPTMDASLRELLEGDWRGAIKQVCDDAESYSASPWMRVPPGSLYRPLEDEPALFRTFADLPVADDPDALLGFAAKYGALRSIGIYYLPDTRSAWMYEHARLSMAVTLFDALRTGTEPDVMGRIRLEPARYHDGERLPDRNRASAMLPGSSAECGMCILRAEASPREVLQNVLATLLRHALTDGAVTPSLSVDGKVYGPGLRLSLLPRDLAGAMWLQLALAVDGNRTYAQCPVCKAWRDTTGEPASKEVCSEKCRQRRNYLKRTGKWSESEEADDGTRD